MVYLYFKETKKVSELQKAIQKAEKESKSKHKLNKIIDSKQHDVNFIEFDISGEPK